MNKIVLSLLAFFVCFAGFSQTSNRGSGNEPVCRIGFTYEISHSPHWGYGKPVVTSVQPYSAAEQNGLQINDIIEFIDSVAVADIPVEEISARLNIEGKDETVLIVSNLSSSNKRIWIKKDCKTAAAITEAQLAQAFYLYSPETTAQRIFTCPFTTTTTLETIDFSNFRTFAFAAANGDNSELELVINDCIEQELLKKGLDIDFVSPDILIETYYLFDKNQEFRGKNIIEIRKTPVYRFDTKLKKMVELPFLNHSTAEAEAEYILQLGFRFIDQKFTPGRIVWECEANELMENAFTLENYARLHIPLMCMQYPYVKYTANVPFKVDQTVYNYTGIQYDLNQLGRIKDVEKNSPAASAGLRKGDRIENIREQAMPDSWDTLSANYRNFVTQTSLYRNQDTRFRHPDYTTYTMYWDEDFYTQIADTFSNPESQVPFSYLFSYAPYIDPSGTNRCSFVIKRGNTNHTYVVRPSLRMEQMVYVR